VRVCHILCVSADSSGIAYKSLKAGRYKKKECMDCLVHGNNTQKREGQFVKYKQIEDKFMIWCLQTVLFILYSRKRFPENVFQHKKQNRHIN